MPTQFEGQWQLARRKGNLAVWRNAVRAPAAALAESDALHKKGRGSFARCPFTSRSFPTLLSLPFLLASKACFRRSHSLKSQRSLPSRSLVSLRQSPVPTLNPDLITTMHFLTLASIALTAAAGASAIVIPRSHVHHARIEKPDTYYEGYLEPYATYHARYMAIDCEDKHNTSYFDRCCHPMLATETLAKNRDADCNPANLPKSSSAVSTASASASVASAAPSATSTQILSSTGDDGDDDDCEDDEPTSTASSAAPTSTSSDDGDDDDDDCDDEGDEPSSSAAPSTTHVATSSTHVASSTHVVTSSTHSATTEAVTTSSTHVATTSSTHTTKVATTTKTSSTPTSTSSSGGSDTFSGGHATFFYQGGQAGACGTVHSDDSLVAAIQTKRYGNLSAKSSNCGRKIKLINTNNKKSVTVTVADACPTCPDENDLDLSVGAFTQIATEEEGEVPITWNFLD